MRSTEVSNPQYYHKVVDCHWACPAHTNVPECIRLIANGRYTDAYMVNRESNVFPGILRRTCDRPYNDLMPVPPRLGSIGRRPTRRARSPDAEPFTEHKR